MNFNLSAAAALGAVPICCAASWLAFGVGKRWAPRAPWAVALGMVSGLLCSISYLALALAVETYWPATLDPHSVGHSLALSSIAAPLCGAIGAYFGFITT